MVSILVKVIELLCKVRLIKVGWPKLIGIVRVLHLIGLRSTLGAAQPFHNHHFSWFASHVKAPVHWSLVYLINNPPPHSGEESALLCKKLTPDYPFLSKILISLTMVTLVSWLL